MEEINFSAWLPSACVCFYIARMIRFVSSILMLASRRPAGAPNHGSSNVGGKKTPLGPSQLRRRCYRYRSSRLVISGKVIPGGRLWQIDPLATRYVASPGANQCPARLTLVIDHRRSRLRGSARDTDNSSKREPPPTQATPPSRSVIGDVPLCHAAWRSKMQLVSVNGGAVDLRV